MSKKYFVRIDGEQKGPYELSQLPEAGVTPDTWIWCKGMDDWTQARHDAEVCRMFRQRLFDMAHPALSDNTPVGEEVKESSADNLEDIPLRFRHLVERDGTPVGKSDTPKPDYSTPPRSYMIEAVVITLICSLLGVVAIYYAWSARKAWAEGKGEEAYDRTRSAKMWIGISFFVGIIANSLLGQMLMR